MEVPDWQARLSSESDQFYDHDIANWEKSRINRRKEFDRCSHDTSKLVKSPSKR